MAIWSRLTTAIAGIAIGEAGAAAVEPVLEQPKQQAWRDNAYRILDLNSLARLAAQGLVDPNDGTVLDYVKRNGYSADKLDALIQLNLKAPDLAEVLTLWRRGRFGSTDPASPPEEVTHALAKEQIEAQYWPAVLELFFERLSVQDVAVMVQRGILPNPGWLPVGPPTAVGRVPPMPQANIDPVAEARSQGFDAERASALAKIIGLPASPDLAARMVFREIIDRIDFDRAIAEGNTRNEWAPFLFEGFREIITAHDGVEARLRGWLDDAGMYAQTARHGMSQEDTDLLFKITGRPIAPHRVFIGERRGGIYDGPIDAIDAAFLKAQKESNERPEWYNLDWAARFTKPSVFVVRQWVKDGHDPAVARQWLWETGWEQADIDHFIAAYSPASTATPATDKHVTSAQTALITAIRKAFLGNVLDVPTARTQLESAGLGATVADQVLVHWEQLKALETTPPPVA